MNKTSTNNPLSILPLGGGGEGGGGGGHTCPAAYSTEDEQCNIEKENLKSLSRHISRNANVEELRSSLHKKKKALKHLCRKKKRHHYNRIIKCIDLSNAKIAWRQLRKLFNLGKSKNMQKNTSEDLEKFYIYFKKLNARKQQNEEYIPTRSEALGPR